jgi:hypothetical protein
MHYISQRTAHAHPEVLMKRSHIVQALALLSAAAVLGSCASKASVPAQMPAPGAQAGAPGKVAKQRTVVTKVPVLVKETSYYSDGLVDEYITYKLDDTKKNVVEKATFDPSRPDPVERVVTEYGEGRPTAESIYDSDAKLRSRRELGYDFSGRLISERMLDANGKAQSSSAYAYDAEGRKTEWKALDGSGAVKAISSYTYGGKDLTGVAIKDSGGTLSGTIKLDYADGALAKRSYFGADGTLQKYEAYLYEGGRLAALENRRADGSLASRVAYEYGSSGELAKASEYDSSGALKGYTTYEYVVREDSAVETYYE